MSTETTTMTPASGYPVRFDVVYQERLSRVSTLLRLFLVIPLGILLGILVGYDYTSYASESDVRWVSVSIGALGSLILTHWIVIFLRRRPVGWLFDAIVNIDRFALRAVAYFLLLVDRYPAFEGDWIVNYYVDQPPELSRWKLVFWKLITALPHIVILLVLSFVVGVVVFIAWFAILFTGRFPRGLHDLVEGVIRWGARVDAYVMSLTDAYPPFSLN